jgi:hypothetical protein
MKFQLQPMAKIDPDIQAIQFTSRVFHEAAMMTIVTRPYSWRIASIGADV